MVKDISSQIEVGDHIFRFIEKVRFEDRYRRYAFKVRTNGLSIYFDNDTDIDKLEKDYDLAQAAGAWIIGPMPFPDDVRNKYKAMALDRKVKNGIQRYEQQENKRVREDVARFAFFSIASGHAFIRTANSDDEEFLSLVYGDPGSWAVARAMSIYIDALEENGCHDIRENCALAIRFADTYNISGYQLECIIAWLRYHWAKGEEYYPYFRDMVSYSSVELKPASPGDSD